MTKPPNLILLIHDTLFYILALHQIKIYPTSKFANSSNYSTTIIIISRLTIVSRKAKKKQTVRDEQVSYLRVAPL